MEYIDKLIEKIRELAKKMVEALLGSAPEAEPELIPIPVHDRHRR